MKAIEIAALSGELRRFLDGFAPAFRTRHGREHLRTYVEGQLGPLERKSVEPIADAAGVPMRSLNDFLAEVRWDEDAVRDHVQRIVAAEHRGAENVLILDESGFPKKGNDTACVQRQYCGASGKIDNCVVGVFAAFASGDFHTLIDGALYVPKDTWAEKPKRREKAGIPDDVGYRPIHEIGLELVRRAKQNGVPIDWVVTDERYAEVPAFLTGLEEEGLHYVLEVPRGFSGWTQRPPTHAGDEDVRLARILADAPRPQNVASLTEAGATLARKPFTAYHVKDTFKGPEVWEARECAFFHHRSGRVSGRLRLIHMRHVLDKTEKYFVANAPADVPIETILRVALTRWRVERCFEDSKGEIGLDHFEVRGYGSIKRHLVLSLVSHLFLARQKARIGGEKALRHRVPAQARRRGAAARRRPRPQSPNAAA